MTERRDQLRAYYDTEMVERVHRPLGADRESHLAGFIEECRARGLRRVVEVGCGAGRDATRITDAGLQYAGLDLSSTAVDICRGLGLEATEGLATELPFPDSDFDAGWTMSTLMHLEGEDMVVALAELARVVRPGGVVEVGVWGSIADGDRVADDGRYFRHRTDDRFRALMSEIGDLEAFDTWDWHDDGTHYQWARVTVRAKG